MRRNRFRELSLVALLVLTAAVASVSAWAAFSARAQIDSLESEVERLAVASADTRRLEDTQDKEIARIAAFLDGLPGGGESPEFLVKSVQDLNATMQGICDLTASGYGIREVTSDEVDTLLDFIRIPCRRFNEP